MGIVVILLALLVIELFNMFNRDSVTRKAKKKYGLKKVTLIRYDKAGLKQQLTVSIVLTVVSAVGGIAMLFMWNMKASDINPLVVLAISVVLYLIPVAIVQWLQYADGRMYIKMLTKHGFMVPEHKKDFDYIVEVLPRKKMPEDENIIPVEKPRNRESIILMAACGAAAAVIMAATFRMHQMWSFYTNAVTVIYGIFAFAWAVGCLVYYLQSDEHKYKDEVEIESLRKARRRLGSGIVQYVICGAFTLIILLMTNSVTEYSCESYIEFVRSTLEPAREAVEQIMDMYEEDTEIYKEYYSRLSEGVEFVGMNREDSNLAEEIFDVLREAEKEPEWMRNVFIGRDVSYVIKIEDGKVIAICDYIRDEAAE